MQITGDWRASAASQEKVARRLVALSMRDAFLCTACGNGLLCIEVCTSLTWNTPQSSYQSLAGSPSLAFAVGVSVEIRTVVRFWVLNFCLISAWRFIPLSLSRLQVSMLKPHSNCFTICPDYSVTHASGQDRHDSCNASTSSGEHSNSESSSSSDGDSDAARNIPGQVVQPDRDEMAAHINTNRVGAIDFPNCTCATWNCQALSVSAGVQLSRIKERHSMVTMLLNAHDVVGLQEVNGSAGDTREFETKHPTHVIFCIFFVTHPDLGEHCFASGRVLLLTSQAYVRSLHFRAGL